jgi:hypothetical protein
MGEVSSKLFFRDQRILKVSSCKNVEIILHRDLSWAHNVNYTVQKAWRALHIIMCVLRKGNSTTKRLASSHYCIQFLNMGLHVGAYIGKVR